jgi:hypothetical protein
MPYKNGIQVAKEIRKNIKDGMYRNKYNIALFTGDLNEVVNNVKNYEEIFDFVLEKPINKKDIERLLHKSNIT